MLTSTFSKTPFGLFVIASVILYKLELADTVMTLNV